MRGRSLKRAGGAMACMFLCAPANVATAAAAREVMEMKIAPGKKELRGESRRAKAAN